MGADRAEELLTLRRFAMRGPVRAVALGAAALIAGAAPAATKEARCRPADGLRFICGTGAAEDIVRVPRSRWLIASGLNVGHPASLRAIDDATRTAKPLAVRFAAPPAASACPGPPDPARWSTNGLAIVPVAGGARLFALNSGDRRAVEIFQVGGAPGEPRATWIDCAPLPAHTLGNGVVAVGPDDIVVTSFHDPDDPKAWDRMAAGAPTGSVWRWQRDGGFRQMQVGPVSGANGVELSADHRTLYVSAWSARTLLAIDLVTGRRRDLPLRFMPDNLHRAPDGTLLVAGQLGTVDDIARCGAQCPRPWIVARVDPATFAVTTLARGNGDVLINYACGALEVGRRIYITARGDDRIAYLRR